MGVGFPHQINKKMKMSFVSGVVITTVLSIIAWIVIPADPVVSGICVFLGLKAYLAFAASHYYTTGHGVGVRKVRMIAKMPAVFWVFGLLIITICIVALTQLHTPETIESLGAITAANIMNFIVVVLIGTVISVLRWYLGGYEDTFFGSEYEARVEFEARGYSPEEIERRIAVLRQYCDERGVKIDKNFNTATIKNFFGEE